MDLIDSAETLRLVCPCQFPTLPLTALSQRAGSSKHTRGNSFGACLLKMALARISPAEPRKQVPRRQSFRHEILTGSLPSFYYWARIYLCAWGPFPKAPPDIHVPATGCI